MYVQKVWAIMLGLPTYLQKEEILENLGNLIGHFVCLEQGWRVTPHHRCLQMMIEIDLREGILEDIEIFIGKDSR